MKKLSLLLVLLLSIGCGAQYSGIVMPVATNAYFNLTMVGQTWQFVDSYNHHLWIDLYQVPCAFGHCDQNIIVMHYHKDSCPGYWGTRTPEQCAVATHLDELWFVLAEGYQTIGQPWVHDGAWRCIGYNYIDYMGAKHSVQIVNRSTIAPYTIVPSVIGVPPYTYYVAYVNDLFTGNPATDFNALPGPDAYVVPWQTDGEYGGLYSPFAGSITALISWQYEGCVAEHWYYKMNVGLVAIFPVVGLGNGGACISLDPGLVMSRVS